MTAAEIQDFGQLVRDQASRRGEHTAFRFFPGGDLDAPAHMLTYAGLDRAARAVAAGIQQRASAGDRVLLLFPSGLDFVVGFVGCLYAGVAAVPTPIPAGQRHQVARLSGIAANASARLVLTSVETAGLVDEAMRGGVLPTLPCLTVGTDATCDPDTWSRPRITASTIAFLQYTSGSTGAPKGVVVRHGNLVHNEGLIRRAFDVDEQTRSGGWLPLFHDMGLIGQVLGVLHTGGVGHLMSPVDFLKAPHRWLQMVSRFGLEISGGPDFAYDLCVRRISDEVLETLDLSTWRVAYNGSEPVRAATVDAFARRFGAVGFDRRAFFPCYGLAESTLFVSGGPAGSGAHVVPVDRARLGRGTVEPTEPEPGCVPLVSCGRPDPAETDVAIVDADTRRRLPAGRIGEVWVRGQSVCSGYWHDPARLAEDAAVFGATLEGAGGYLRTGDLGALVDGELVVTGRHKEMMVIRGRNIYPHDVETDIQTVHPATRGRLGAAFSVDTGEERLVVVQEARPGQLAGSGPDTVVRAIRARLADSLQLRADAVVLVRPGAVLRTTSGKVQRTSMRARFLADELDALHEDVHPAVAALRATGRTAD